MSDEDVKEINEDTPAPTDAPDEATATAEGDAAAALDSIDDGGDAVAQVATEESPDAPEEAPEETPEASEEAPEATNDAPDDNAAEAGQSGPATAEVAATPVHEEAPTPVKTGLSQIPIAGQFVTNTEYRDGDGELDEEKGEYMNEIVIAHFTCDMKGCITIKMPYDFKKHEQWRLPRWFAVQFPQKIVIRQI